MKQEYDLIIVGGGPAGLSAAIYARRANLDVLVIEDNLYGGKLPNIHQIDNYPGFTSISGIDLANNLFEHAKSVETQIVNDRVTSISDNTVYLNNNDSIKAKAILIATGSKQRKLDIPRASEFEGKGISYCATCDGFFFRNKNVCVIGDSKEAQQEALYLSSIVSNVTIVTKRNDINIDESLAAGYNNANNINFIYNVIPNSLVIENEKIIGIQVSNINDNSKNVVECSGIFPYISFNPSTNFVDEKILDDKGFIITNPDMSTSIKGIYAAGDCIQKDLRQVVTACSDGAIAAMSIIKYLKNKA